MGFTREKILETSYPVFNLDIDTLVTGVVELMIKALLHSKHNIYIIVVM